MDDDSGTVGTPLTSETLTASCRQWGADFVGVADLGPAREAVVAQGGDWLATFPRALSLGVRLLDSLVDQLPRHRERVVALNYRHHGYDVVNARLDQLAARAASRLQQDGWMALPVPASQRVDDEQLAGLFSHKLAAHLAGLGWIGRNCCVITPQAGPRVRWTTVLTDAPLRPGTPLEQRCGSCTACVVACPAQAFTGAAFRAQEPRAARFDVHACVAYQEESRRQTGLAVCGMCLYSCPQGRRGG